MTGQFLSRHVAVKQIEGKVTFNLFYCYVSAQELPSHTCYHMYKRYDLESAILRWRYDLDCDYVSLCAFGHKFWKSHLRWRRGRCTSKFAVGSAVCRLIPSGSISDTSRQSRTLKWRIYRIVPMQWSLRCPLSSMSVHIPPQAEATQASLVPDLSATSEAMDSISFEFPVTSVCNVSEDSASLLGEDYHQRTMVSDLYGYWSNAFLQLTFNSVWETLDYMDKLLQQLLPAEDGSSMDYSPFYQRSTCFCICLVHRTKPMVIPNGYFASFISYLHVFGILTQCSYMYVAEREHFGVCVVYHEDCEVCNSYSFCNLVFQATCWFAATEGI